MAPRLPLPSLMHRARAAHPLAPGMRRTLARLERATPDEVRDWQDRRLRLLVAWAARTSPFYRSWFAENDVSPADVRTQDDLHLLPLLDRSDLAADPARFCSYPRRSMWPARSSGTSGQVVTVYRTPGASAYELAALQRQWSWFGLSDRPRRVTVRAAGATASDPSEVATQLPGSRQLLVSAYVLERADPAELLRTVRDFAPDAVEGWPSSLTTLAGILDRRGERLPVAAVITSSETTSSHQVEMLHRVFGGPVVDHYGQTERVCMAGSCEAGGYHLFSDYAVTELLPVPGRDAQWELVGTPLHNWGFPLLRYRTGDTVGPPSSGPCGCGRPFPVVHRVDGRTEDAFTAADGRSLPMPGIVVGDVVGLAEVQVGQRAPGVFEVRMVPRPGTDLDAVRAQVLANVDRYFGPGQTVEFVRLARIPRPPSGKLRPAVVDTPPVPVRVGPEAHPGVAAAHDQLGLPHTVLVPDTVPTAGLPPVAPPADPARRLRGRRAQRLARPGEATGSDGRGPAKHPHL